MKRRTAIRSLGALTAGIALFPGCSDGLTIEFDPTQNFTFDSNQRVWIDAISEAILPKEGLSLTTYEALADYISKMISFDKSDEDQGRFYNGYNLCTEDIKSINKTSTSELSPTQIISYFTSQLENNEVSKDETLDKKMMQKSEDKKFFCQNLRRLVINHLRTSKEYQEDILEYKLAPGSDSYIACLEL